jgi:hypothetical protein
MWYNSTIKRQKRMFTTMNNKDLFTDTAKIVEDYQAILKRDGSAAKYSIAEKAQIIEAYDKINKPGWQLPPREFTEKAVERILGRGRNVTGFCMVSACPHDWQGHQAELHLTIQDLNYDAARKIENDLNHADVGYIPIYGECRQANDDGKEGAKSISLSAFFLPCYDRHRNPMDYEKVKNAAIQLGNKYKQEVIVLNPPNGHHPYYSVTAKYGEEDVGAERHSFREGATLNEIAQNYFTLISKRTCEFISIASDPQSIMEAHSRYARGEIVNPSASSNNK